MSGPGVYEGKKSCRPQGAAFQPPVEHRDLACSRMEALGQSQQARAIPITHAREHDREPSHEETGSHSSPAAVVEVAGHAELDQPLLVIPIHAGWKMAIRRRIGPLHFEHAQARPDSLRQRSKRFEIAAVPTTQTRKGFFPDTGASRPLGIRPTERPRLAGEDGQGLRQRIS
ncbi:MAG TPA: hypothetical protein VNY82_08305 [Steroidobacteraceae bacterium]|nr:hypothetical protein [Steroidobacteraceae bacterium]